MSKKVTFNDSYGPCILSPKVASQLLRAIIGTQGAADLPLLYKTAVSYLEIPKMQVELNVTDFAYEAFGKRCRVPIHADDQDVLARDVVLVKDGKTFEYMTNIESAAALQLPLTGNGRFDGSKTEVHIRNFAVHPGTDTFEEQIASINDGFYLVDAFQWDYTPKDEYAMRIKKAYHIDHGKLGVELAPHVIYGYGSDLLRRITKVGDDFKWYTDDFTKQRGIKAYIGAPHIKSIMNIGFDPFGRLGYR